MLAAPADDGRRRLPADRPARRGVRPTPLDRLLGRPARKPTALGRDDAAVSAVVSAVLVFGLFSTAFVMWTVISLPEWITDREENHQDGVVQDLHAAQADLESLSASDDAGPVQQTIDLRPSQVALLQRSPATADLSYQSGSDILADFPGATVHLLNGETQGTPSQLAHGFTASDVQQLHGLTLALQSRLQGASGDDAITLTFTSTTGSFSATLIHTESPTGCSQNEMRFDVDGSPQILLCDASESMTTPYRFDALRPGSGLSGALARIGTPFDLEVTTSGDDFTATLAAAWLDIDGQMQATGTGSATGFSLDQPGGHVVVGTNPQHHIPQDIVWDFGGIGLVQNDGQTMLQAASFSIDQQGGNNQLDWTLVALSGTPNAVSGDRATLRIEHTGTTDILLEADSGNIGLTTPYADAWADLLETHRAAAGAGDATVTSDGASVQLDLTGTDPWWVHLRIIHATATVS